MGAVVRFLKRIDAAILAVETAIVMAGLLAMVALAFFNVLNRNIGPWLNPKLGEAWTAAINAANEDTWRIAQHLVLWVGMIGASIAAHGRRHISIEVVSKIAGPRARRVIDCVADAATAFTCTFLAWIAWAYIQEIEIPDPQKVFSIGELRFLRWWSLCVIPAGLLLIAGRSVLHGFERAVVGAPPDPDAEVKEAIRDYERRHSSDERPVAPGEPEVQP